MTTIAFVYISQEDHIMRTLWVKLFVEQISTITKETLEFSYPPSPKYKETLGILKKTDVFRPYGPRS